MDQNNNNNNRGGVRNRNGGRLETFVPLVSPRKSLCFIFSLSFKPAALLIDIPRTTVAESRLQLVNCHWLKVRRWVRHAWIAMKMVRQISNSSLITLIQLVFRPAPMPPSSQRRNRIRQSARSVRTSSVHSFIPTQNRLVILSFFTFFQIKNLWFKVFLEFIRGRPCSHSFVPLFRSLQQNWRFSLYDPS